VLHMQRREVKFLDPLQMLGCESVALVCLHWSRTKVKGAKTIRYRRSLNSKRCRPGIGEGPMEAASEPCGKPESLDSGGNMVARLKLKGIDGFNEWKFKAKTGL